MIERIDPWPAATGDYVGLVVGGWTQVEFDNLIIKVDGGEPQPIFKVDAGEPQPIDPAIEESLVGTWEWRKWDDNYGYIRSTFTLMKI